MEAWESSKGYPPQEVPIPRHNSSRTREGEGLERGEERKKGRLGFGWKRSPKQVAKGDFYKIYPKRAQRRVPKIHKKWIFFIFPTGCPGVRAVGPVVARRGRKGVEHTTDTPKRGRTARS